MLTLPLFAALSLLQQTPDADVHVAPHGRDDARGTKDAPFATLERARDAVRALKSKTPVTVLVRGGTYFLDGPLTFTAEDSGTAEAPITYAAWPGETPVLSGGTPITNWKASGKVWVADAPETKQLFVNGRRRPRPRLPREGYFQIAEVLDSGNDAQKGARRFRYKEGDLKAWENLADVEVVVAHFWHEERLPVDSLDESQRVVGFSKRSVRRLTESNGQPARYWVENVPDSLERPGEWYFDRRHGRISYVPGAGEDPAAIQAVAPRLRHVVRFEGAGHVRLRGLTMAHTEGYCPPRKNQESEVCGPSQAAVTAPGAVVFAGARSCALEDCVVAHVGSYGIEIEAGSSDIRIVRCEIHDLGAGGIKIGDWTTLKNPAMKNVVTDNRIHHGGLIYPSGIGVLVLHSGGNVVAHNDIHDFFYTGVSVGWTWGYKETVAHENLVEQNHIHDLGHRVLSDMGGIYTLGTSTGTVLRNNLIHDVDAFDYGGWGIYFDEGSTGILAENNVVYRTKDGGLHQHYGKDNVARNNVFAYAREAQVARSRLENHRSFTFERNIVLWKEGVLFRKGYSDKIGEGLAFNGNVYWASGLPVTFGSKSFEEWQKLGQDKDSLVADPLFVAPEAGNFTLKADSPALNLGFKPIDVSKVGPR